MPMFKPLFICVELIFLPLENVRVISNKIELLQRTKGKLLLLLINNQKIIAFNKISFNGYVRLV